jgi:hypothetical protein
MAAAAGIYAAGPLVKFADSNSVDHFVVVATPALTILGLALTMMAAFLPRPKKDP